MDPSSESQPQPLSAPEVETSGVAQAAESPWLFAAVAGAVLLLAGGALWWTQAPSSHPPVAAEPALAASAPAHDTGAGSMDAMVQRLALRLQQQPADAAGWAMLGRSYAVLGRQPEALAAYQRALALRPEDAALQSEYRAALASQAQDEAPPLAVTPAAPTSGTVSGTVTLARALLKWAEPEDTVFVYARSANGERVPLAVLRRQVKDLPLRFTLDDSMGMSAQHKLSDAGQVTVSARISKSGQAMPQTGDLVGQAPSAKVGTSGFNIEIRDRLE